MRPSLCFRCCNLNTFGFAMAYNGWQIKEVAEAIWAKCSEAFYPLLYDPTPEEKRKMQARCRAYVKQMTHCRQCRADAIGRLGKEIQQQFFARHAQT